MPPNVYHRKLFALLHDPQLKSLYQYKNIKGPWEQLRCLYQYKEELEHWWNSLDGAHADHIASASDRMAFKRIYKDADRWDGYTEVEVRHPLSGQQRKVTLWQGEALTPQQLAVIEDRVIPYELVRSEEDAQKVFWWFWRFYPEAVVQDAGIDEPAALLLPADTRIPDCPIHTHNSTVSALAGAMFPESWQAGQAGAQPYERPYLLLFTFSPVQEFIKSSRKLLDFWSGSYMLHYLSAKLCWSVAEQYGPDAVITPSLWDQEIIDALLLKKYTDFASTYRALHPELHGRTPAESFKDRISTSLATAGFPNMIAVVVPGEQAAQKLGEDLKTQLCSLWKEMGTKVREAIKERVREQLGSERESEALWLKLTKDLALSPEAEERLHRQFHNWRQGGAWEWNKLWDAQSDNAWESYWVSIPLGDPEQPLKGSRDSDAWIEAQRTLAANRLGEELPTEAEKPVYSTLNVGTWWGSFQTRLGQGIQAIKNTRTWTIPAAPGERSTLSGLYSAVHPNLLYKETFREGCGVSSSSQNLFWQLMGEVFPGLFNGSERLNALELTKRLAWKYGGVAEDLGIENDKDDEYENLIRFPNLSSIAAARFAADHPERIREYGENLKNLLSSSLNSKAAKKLDHLRRPFHVRRADAALARLGNFGKGWNGALFSAKWMAEDLRLGAEETAQLPALVEQAHRQSGLTSGSPADWWVLVLADGDGMGRYVSGKKLKVYKEYLATGVSEKLRSRDSRWVEVLEHTKKRMGPATHIGLNRALIDFSNRLVPYLAEERFCGRVVYSGGDDVMAALPLEDLPEFLLSLRAAWSGSKDPKGEFENGGGYWQPRQKLPGLKNRPYFTMGCDATMSAGIVIAHRSVPLPTVLENIWQAEKERAKKIPGKDGLCFRVIYGSGNTLEALMKGQLLAGWQQFMEQAQQTEFSPVLYQLAEELPRHGLYSEAAKVILNRRDRAEEAAFKATSELFSTWLKAWEDWGAQTNQQAQGKAALGTEGHELAALLRFSAFWLDRMEQRRKWTEPQVTEVVR